MITGNGCAPILSVVVTLHNLEKYIGFCLESLVCQSLGEELYEIIVVDNASTDNSLEIAREYEKMYPWVHVIHSDKDRKFPGGLNNGFEHSKGKWLHFVDGDDFVRKNVYKGLIEFAEGTDADMISFGYYRTAYHDFEHGSVFVPKDQSLTGIINTKEKRRALFKINSTLWTRLISRELLDRIRDRKGNVFPEITDPDEKYYDTAETIRIFDIIYHCRHFEIYSEPIYYYWQHTYKIDEEKIKNRILDPPHSIRSATEGGYYDAIKDVIYDSYLAEFFLTLKRMMGFISPGKAWKLGRGMMKKTEKIYPGSVKKAIEENKPDPYTLPMVLALYEGNKGKFVWNYMLQSVVRGTYNRLRNHEKFMRFYYGNKALVSINHKIRGVKNDGRY